ncbi:MAG: ParB/RepB/Spo0J family partition protein [Armatimonadota bacterium]|nr:ParB/RepB/Spo0J family partition protein [bacterium]
MEKKALGRGLGALIPGVEKVEQQQGTEVEVARVSFNPYQPRISMNDEKLQDLINSVRVHGVLQPIVVRSKGDGDYELVAGERRLRAAMAAGLSRIPAVIRELTNEQSLQVALIENIQREDINPLDAAIAYKRLADEFGMSQEDMAFGLGKSRSTVANTMRLLNLPQEVRDHLKQGRISEGHARAILSVDGEGNQIECCRRIVGAGLSVRDSEKLARDWSKEQSSRSIRQNVSRETTPALEDPNILDIEARLRQVFGTKVRLVKNKDRGRLEIEFYTEDDLDRILMLLTGG